MLQLQLAALLAQGEALRVQTPLTMGLFHYQIQLQY